MSLYRSLAHLNVALVDPDDTIARVAMWGLFGIGRRLKPEEWGVLKRLVIQRRVEPASLMCLVGHTQLRRFDVPAFRQLRASAILCLIRDYPQMEVHQWPEAHLDEILDLDEYKLGCNAWNGIRKAMPHDITVQRNADEFLRRMGSRPAEQ
jgi:hypothetical protein